MLIKHAAWFSRHEPSPAMIADLIDFQIVQVNPLGRCFGPGDAYRCIAAAAGFVDVIVYIGPHAWVAPFLNTLRRYQPAAEVIAPIMTANDKNAWSGEWRTLFWSKRQQRVIWGVRWSPVEGRVRKQA